MITLKQAKELIKNNEWYLSMQNLYWSKSYYIHIPNTIPSITYAIRKGTYNYLIKLVKV